MPKRNNSIVSPKNPRLKAVEDLRERRTRNEANLTVVEGFREVLRAVEAGVDFKELYVCHEFFRGRGEQELVQTIKAKKVDVFEITKEAFSKIAYGDRQEGLLAVCRPPRWRFQDLKLGQNPLLVIAEKIEKPGNLGAILRVCDGVAIDGFIVSDGLTDLYNPNVIRASIGTVFSIKVLEASNEETLAFLRKNNIRVCATLPEAQAVYSEMKLDGPLAVIVGSEEAGLSDFWVKAADLKIKVPMQGKADSLNVSVTTAVIIYEAIRQRNAPK